MFRTIGLRAPTTLLLAAIVCLATQARAGLLVYEGFTGYTAGALAGQKPSATTVGLDRNVGYYDDNGTSRTAGFDFTATGLTLGSLATSGGALAYTTTTTKVIGADIDIGATAYTGTLWSSYLTQITTRGAGADNGSLLRIAKSPADNSSIRYTSWADSRSSSPNVAVSYAGTSGNNGTASLTPGTTYIIIARFTGVGTTSGSATLWALDQTQFASFLAAGGTESALDRPNSVTATASHTPATGLRNFITSDALALVTVGGTGVFDEIRFGSSLADVTPTAVPEPSTTTALVGLAALLASVRPRRCRR